MRAVMITLALVACGARPPSPTAPPPAQLVVVEWKVEQGDGDRVNVTLVIDGRAIAIGSLATTTPDASGPATCALRAALQRRTELVCGDASYFEAQLAGDELVVTLVDGDQRSVVKRVPVEGDGLSVKPLVL